MFLQLGPQKKNGVSRVLNTKKYSDEKRDFRKKSNNKKTYRTMLYPKFTVVDPRNKQTKPSYDRCRSFKLITVSKSTA